MRADLTDLQAGDIVRYRIGADDDYDYGVFLHWDKTVTGARCLLLQSLEFGGENQALDPATVLDIYRADRDEVYVFMREMPLTPTSACRVNEVLQPYRALSEQQQALLHVLRGYTFRPEPSVLSPQELFWFGLYPWDLSEVWDVEEIRERALAQLEFVDILKAVYEALRRLEEEGIQDAQVWPQMLTAARGACLVLATMQEEEERQQEAHQAELAALPPWDGRTETFLSGLEHVSEDQDISEHEGGHHETGKRRSAPTTPRTDTRP
jgi:hypothetical protein